MTLWAPDIESREGMGASIRIITKIVIVRIVIGIVISVKEAFLLFIDFIGLTTSLIGNQLVIRKVVIVDSEVVNVDKFAISIINSVTIGIFDIGKVDRRI